MINLELEHAESCFSHCIYIMQGQGWGWRVGTIRPSKQEKGSREGLVIAAL